MRVVSAPFQTLSEFVALDRELRSRQGDPILVVGSSDALVPKFRDRAAAGRGIEKLQPSVGARRGMASNGLPILGV